MPPEAIPVEIVSSTDVSKVTKGNEKGKKDEPPKVVAEKVDAARSHADPNLKRGNAGEVAPTAPAPRRRPRPSPRPRSRSRRRPPRSPNRPRPRWTRR